MPTLTSDVVDTIRRAAQPLAPDRRQAFVADVTAALQSVPVIGDGILHRVIVEVQRQHFDPPRFPTTMRVPHAGGLR